MKTPQPYNTPDGTAVDLGTLYRYDTKKGVRYILSGWRQGNSPDAFFITRDQVLDPIDKLLSTIDAQGSKPVVKGNASAKWKGE